MEFPAEILQIIYDYSRPISRSNWRHGGAFPSYLFWIGYDDYMNRRDYESIILIASNALTAEEFEDLF